MRGTLRVFICLLLPIVALAAGAPSSAQAQQQEKRIALVVGNGTYSKSPLATTANDAGLIAQTLQAAGFDVVGARDLDGDTLRKSFRDFIQKAQASGPGTVAMVYLAGYGVQLAGENYFIPVDSNISRDTDIPTEALRISDYARQLASIPLKASILVLDAARAQPFIEGGQPIASGLALVEPEANMLIAFNAAPGTVAPEEPGPYGIYAQSLAEMIRTGGLSLAEVFDRVRLRVNEASKGAQVPWNEQKISAQFSFFDRGPDAPPPQAAPDQVAAVRNKPIRDLGVQDAYAAALERDTLAGYEEFLAAYPGDPLAKRVMAIVAARREAITWRRTYRTDTPEAYWSYLRRYPRGPHAGDARRRLAILTAPAEPPPSFAMIDYDVPPPPPEEVVYVDRPVLYFSDPDFGFAPPPPPPVYFCPPPPPDFVVLPPPLPVVGLFVLPQPVFVPIPVFVQPPVYVSPPPNNIIFQNMHNTTVINTVINRPMPPPPPGNVTAAVSVAAGTVNGGAITHVPTTVQEKALQVQKDPTRPLNASQEVFVKNPTAKLGSVAAAKSDVSPAAKTQQTDTGLQGHALPHVDQKAGPGALGTGLGTGPQPGLRPGLQSGSQLGQPSEQQAPKNALAPAMTAPANGPAKPGAPGTGAGATTSSPGKPPVGQTPVNGPEGQAKATSREQPAVSHQPEGSGNHQPGGLGGPGKPGPGEPKITREDIKNLPSKQITRPTPPGRLQNTIRPTTLPPPRMVPPPSARLNGPPPGRPAPPPVAARPAPPPPVVRAPPPPVARQAPPPPPVTRPAPPPPPPRMAVAPPPRPPAPPPRPPAPPAAKKCPPNQPRC